jgi:hypothetical protein
LQVYLDSVYLNHFALFVESIYILLSDSMTEQILAEVEAKLSAFYKAIPQLYGLKICGLNVHNVGAHLVWYVRQCGPLCAWSCFPYEDMNGNVLSWVHGTGNVCV